MVKTAKLLQLKIKVLQFIQGRTLGVRKNMIGAELPKLSEITDTFAKVPATVDGPAWRELYDQVGRVLQELKSEGKIRKSTGNRWAAIP